MQLLSPEITEPALRRLRQDENDFEARQGYIVSSGPTQVAEQEPFSQNETNR